MEQEADDFDALLDDITKPEPAAANANAGQPMPTGTFRNSENDGWEDLNFGEKQRENKFGASGRYKPGGLMSSKSPALDDDDDILDNMLDDIA